MTKKLNDDDRNAWLNETKTITKKHRKKTIEASVDLDEVAAPMAFEHSTPMPTTRPKSLPSPRTSTPLSPLSQGNFSGVDAATVRRIKRAQMPIGSRVDLHGMTQAEAYDSLLNFIENATHQQKRLLLVITGKGKLSEGGGVLKTMLPRWLNTPELRPHILAFDTAQIAHGGSGAFYVLLKRNKL